jgi:phospholipase/carboxylesterase
MTSETGSPGLEHVFRRGPGGLTLLLLHGTGGDEHQLLELGRRLAPRASLLSPRGAVLEGVSRRFFRRHSPTELDLDDLRERTDELAEFVRSAAARYALDPERVVAAGYSNGANIAVSLLFRQPGLLRGAVLLRPTLPFEPAAPPRLAGTDVLIASGNGDPWVPPAKAERLAALLRSGGATVSARSVDAGHELTALEVAHAGAWLEQLEEVVPVLRD